MKTPIRGDSIKWLAVLTAVLLVADLLMDKPGHLPWERWFAAYALAGLVATAFLGLITPALARLLLRKESDDV